LAALAERRQRRHEVALLLGGRFARAAVLTLVAGETAVRLDVEAKPVGGPLGPGFDNLGSRDPVERGVDLDDREVGRVEGQLVLLPAPPLELRWIEVGVVGPIAGADG